MPDIRNQSFSGTDVVPVAYLKGKRYELGTLQTISISTYRDTVPIRALGLDRPNGYKQGTRTTSGSLVFTKVNYSEFDRMIKDNSILSLGDTVGYQAPDRVAAFDIHLHKLTEYGDISTTPGTEFGKVAILKDVVLMTAGTVMSINDVFTESTYNYLATEFIDFNTKDQTDNGLESQVQASTYYKNYILKA